FPTQSLDYFLSVVAVGGLGSIKGSLIAAIVLGVCDDAGKYYLPDTGAFIIYVIMVSLLLWRPLGLFGRR
ncbi:MAG: branched-chain amino acid ABC transporter permease, partial [Ferrovibrionaceae bacterium]